MSKYNNPMSHNGSCLQGYVRATRAQLVEEFGAPNRASSDKVIDEWVIKSRDLDPDAKPFIITIYDYKLDQRLADNQLYDWHVGGHGQYVLEMLRDLQLKVETRE